MTPSFESPLVVLFSIFFIPSMILLVLYKRSIAELAQPSPFYITTSHLLYEAEVNFLQKEIALERLKEPNALEWLSLSAFTSFLLAFLPWLNIKASLYHKYLYFLPHWKKKRVKAISCRANFLTSFWLFEDFLLFEWLNEFKRLTIQNFHVFCCSFFSFAWFYTPHQMKLD